MYNAGGVDGGGANRRQIKRNTDDDNCGGSSTRRGNANVLIHDDMVTLVWTASSGGKTQTLFKYTVQSGSAKPK
jgi:hypothetical protein